MLVLNKKVIEILQEITELSGNFIVKGGSSLLIRNYFSDLEDYRGSMDIDITTTNYKKGSGPRSQYEPKSFKLNEFLDKKEIKYVEEKNNPRRMTFTFTLDNQTIRLESSVPGYDEYSEFEIIGGIRVAKLQKIFADKLMILIEYNSRGIDLEGEYLRHLIDIMLMEEMYYFSIKKSIEEIVSYVRKRIESLSKDLNNKDIYDELYLNFEKMVDSLLKQGTNNFNKINSIIREHPYMHKKIDGLINKEKVSQLREVIKNV